MPGANPTTAIAPTIVSAPRSFVSDNRACSATNDSTDRSAPASTDRTANDRTRRAAYQRATPGTALRVCFSEKRNCHDCKQRQQEQESIHFITSQISSPRICATRESRCYLIHHHRSSEIAVASQQTKSLMCHARIRSAIDLIKFD
jgi:hypothetical protein